MSVKVGMILEGKKTYVAGAPRSSDTGQVLMFQLGSNGILKLDKQHYLSGEQFGSSFGFDIAIADFNSDGCVMYMLILCAGGCVMYMLILCAGLKCIRLIIIIV